MAVKDSGASLAISEIVTEFGDNAGGSDSMSEYYAGGDNVPSGAAGESGDIPGSGTISMSQFYGSTNRIAIALTISSTTQNYNIYSSRGGTYQSGISDVTLTVQAIVGAAQAGGTYALDTGNQWASGDTVKIINNSQIVGAGGGAGQGGAGGNGGAAHAGQAGQAASSAINLGIDTTIQNNGGNIRGGGGGGGGGGNSFQSFDGKGGAIVHTASGGGGGGGAGQNGGAAGARGAAGNANGNNLLATNGQAGSISGGGAGGAGVTDTQTGTSGAGGAGGAFGAAGAVGGTGDDGQSAGGAGGAAGKAINLNGNSVSYEDGDANVQGAVS